MAHGIGGEAMSGPVVSTPVVAGNSLDARDLPSINLHRGPDSSRQINTRRASALWPHLVRESNFAIPLRPRAPLPNSRTPVLGMSFEGMSAASIGASWTPPDPNGYVGRNHYVQMVNMAYQVFDKAGHTLAGPFAINTLWAGQGNRCAADNGGDPIVLYDHLADRWVLSQFAVSAKPYYECIAVSQSPDPTGAYYLYAFNLGSDFPDYPKLGVWPDAYYMTTSESTYSAYAFDRASMLTGNAATFVKFSGESNLLLPSDLDGSALPPPNSPNYLYTFKDTAFHGGIDRVEIFEFKVDFTVPSSATFELAATIPIAPFVYTVCGFFNMACIPQRGTSQKLDSISEWPMWRFQYRNFGAYATLVGNFTVDVDGSNWAGIRWFELRKTVGHAWTLYQEGLQAPDTNQRWNGSIAMDRAGNIALGYSVSSSSMYPEICYTTRLVTDPPGTFQTEEILIAGSASQVGSNRWGDYSAMTVDPTDDCTFWYTNQYYTTNNSSWRTHIGSFQIPGCMATENQNRAVGGVMFFIETTSAASMIDQDHWDLWGILVGGIAASGFLVWRRQRR